MELRFKSLSIFEFQEKFPDDEACLAYLAELRWKASFKCTKCGHKNYCRAIKEHDRQCTSCRKTHSPTSGSLFHGVKFSLLKAFYIVYYVATSKKGISSTELSRKLQLRQKTCWLFKHKVMKAMASSGNYLMEGDIDVDETYIGGQDEEAIGRNEGKKKLAVIAIEKKGKGIVRMYGKVIPTAAKEHLQAFMQTHISPKAGKVRTDGWNGYKGLDKVFANLVREKSEKKGRNFKKIHRSIMLFKAWLRGIHHSVVHLQAYMDEYTYRFNRHFMKEGIFENLMRRMMLKPPYTYKMILN
jgi:hypothetical protein